MAVRPNDFLPQRFSGRDIDDPRAHVLSFGDYIQAQALDNEETIIQRFKATLSGHARSWIKTTTFNPATWDTVRNEFVRYFTGSHSELGNSVKLDDIKLNSKDNLGHHLSRLILMAKESFANLNGEALDKILYPRFLGGLPKNLRLELAKTGEKDLEELVKKGQLISDLDPSFLEWETPHKAVSFQTQQDSIIHSTTHSIDMLNKTIADLNLSTQRLDKQNRSDSYTRSDSQNRYRGRNSSHERNFQ